MDSSMIEETVITSNNDNTNENDQSCIEEMTTTNEIIINTSGQNDMNTCEISNEVIINQNEQHETTISTGDMDMDTLCDRVYTRILDLAKDKHILQTGQNDSVIDKFLSQSEISMEEENRRAYAPASILTNNNIVYGVLKHTCLNCSKSFEQAKHLRRHFILEHIVYKPTYKCDFCESIRGPSIDNIYDLDSLLIHLLSNHNNLNENLENLYDLFVLKYTQDIFCDYFMSGHFFIEAQQMKHINKLKFGKENCTLIQKMHSKIFENYFINDDNGSFISDPNEPLTCKPPVMLTSKSIKSNLLYSQITKASIFKEIVEYLKIDPSKMNNDAYKAYQAVQVQPLVANLPVAGAPLPIPTHSHNQQPNCPDNIKYNQCKFCMKIFKECNAYKEHLMEIHTFNEFCNRCLVCPYCRQLLKSNFESNVNANVLLNNHIRKCSALKADLAHVFNSFRNTAENDFSFLNNNNSNNYNNLQSSNSQSFMANSHLPAQILSHHNSMDDSMSQPITPQSTINQLSSSTHHQDFNHNTSVTTQISEIPVITNGKKRDFEELLQFKNRNLTIKKVKLTNPLKTIKLAEPKKCALCDFKPDLSANSLNKHLVEEHLTIRCVVCEEFVIEKNLSAHINEIHVPESKEICFACPYEPISEDCKHHLELNEFIRHQCLVDRLSEFKTNKSCPICDDLVTISDEDLANNNLSNLEKHFLVKHAVSMYNCELCTASFRDSWYLIEHILSEHKDACEQSTIKHLKCLKCHKIVPYHNDDSLIEHTNSCITKIPNRFLNDDHATTTTTQSGNNDDNSLVNSNLFLNPLSILSNVSTSVPHILSVGSLIDENNLITTSEIPIERNESLNGNTVNDASTTQQLINSNNTSNDLVNNQEECIQEVKLEDNFTIENETIITSDMITTTHESNVNANESNPDLA